MSFCAVAFVLLETVIWIVLSQLVHMEISFDFCEDRSDRDFKDFLIAFYDGFGGDSEFLTKFEVVFSVDNKRDFFAILLFSFLNCVFDKRERKLMRSGFSFCFLLFSLLEQVIEPFADCDIQGSGDAVAIDGFGTDALRSGEYFSVL